jgi:hypothetical protein
MLACCSADLLMQAICLKLMAQPPFDLLVPCWHIVPSIYLLEVDGEAASDLLEFDGEACL